ncbi:MAG: class I SAM-dependent methyltransferase [Chthoniobacterales bacterium]|nr:class I SAM-dependent methyltransferase [Chthoniobacterales bacterium]
MALFAPNTAGYYEGLEAKIESLTLLSAKQVFPLLLELSGRLRFPEPEIIRAEEFCEGFGAVEEARELKRVLDAYGCDKSLSHNYHHLYAAVLKDLGSVSRMLEIGLGTTHTDVVSNMGASWTPGNSLRAFRQYLPGAEIHGADFDRRILFQEERITTHFVDQTELATLRNLTSAIPGALDLLIDDGLHAPNANLATLIFGLEKVREGGWIVIEDIAEEALPFWKTVLLLIGGQHACYLISAHGGFVFALKKGAIPASKGVSGCLV